jgi:hypothetical protein
MIPTLPPPSLLDSIIGAVALAAAVILAYSRKEDSR